LQVDAVVFSSLKDGSPSYWTQRELCAWFHRINALTADERKRLPGAKGVLVPQPAPLANMDRY
jgi:hypothetical protein